VIQAEDFDVGGEGVAYHDTDAGNNGGQYRTAEDVDVQGCSDEGGGHNVGWLIEGEWLEYTLDVPVAGEYPIDVRVASPSLGGAFRIEFDGVDRTGEVVVPVTGGWQTWTTVSTTALLPSGPLLMRFVPTIEGFNLNWIDIRQPTTAVPPEVPPLGFALHPGYPNPFNPSTIIAYDLPEPATVDLVVFDVTGRVVRTLVAGERVPAGRHEAVWNGRDAAGRSVAAGVYLCRLAAGGYVETRSLSLVK
jgi:hypothetical protein